MLPERLPVVKGAATPAESIAMLMPILAWSST
jgi:hypothetical protein